MCFNYHWPQLSQRHFAACDWLAWWLCLKRKTVFLIAACHPEVPNGPQFFLFLDVVLQWIHKVLPFSSQPMIIPLQLAIQKLSPSSACEQSSRMTLLRTLALRQDCERMLLPSEVGGLKRERSQDKVRSCKHPVNQQGVVPTGNTYLNREDNVFIFIHSLPLPAKA